MTGRSGLLSIALAALVAASLAACGGDDAAVPTDAGAEVSQAELEAAVRSGRDEVAAVTERVGEAESADDLSAALAQGAERLRASAEEVEQVDASGDVAEARDRFVAALRGLADDFESAAGDVAEEDWQQAAIGIREGRALEEVERSLEELQARGVDVEALDVRSDVDLGAEATRLQAELDRLLRDLSAARSTDEAADAMEASAARLRTAADELGAAEARAGLEGPRDETVDAARRLADQLESSAPAAREADLREAVEEARALDAVADLRSALDELRARGVTVEETEASGIEQAARAARDEVERALADLRDARSADDVADRMEAGAERIRTAADEVEAAEAESDAEPAQRRLAGALRDLAAELESAAPEIRGGNVAQALQRVRALDAVDEIEQALLDLRQQGVDVPELSRP